MKEIIKCWCQNKHLNQFSVDYGKCSACGTLVSLKSPGVSISVVNDDNKDFYGREYWFSHQEKDLGYDNIVTRSRTDLYERCIYWLQKFIKYKLPPARSLELGCAHGAFVAMLQWAGFDASGLELSPFIVDYAKKTFDVPVFLGPVENQNIQPQSLDSIILMDVLEHLPDPVGTMRHCLKLLKPDGVFLIQTPRYTKEITYEMMIINKDPFLEQLKSNEHIYLFSEDSIKEFFKIISMEHLKYEQAFFSHYDMFLLASGVPFVENNPNKITRHLCKTVGGRLVQALLDLDNHWSEIVQEQHHRLSGLEDLQNHFNLSEADRAARLKVIEEQGRKLGEVEAERNRLNYAFADLQKQFNSAEADRAARLKVIEEQGLKLGEMVGKLSHIQSQYEMINNQLNTNEEIRKSQKELLNVQEHQIQIITSQLHSLQKLITGIQKSHIYRFFHYLGCFKRIE